MMNMAPKISGLVFARQLWTKDQEQHLVVARFQSRDAFEKLVDSKEYTELMTKIPEEVKHIRTECFEVVSDVFPK